MHCLCRATTGGVIFRSCSPGLGIIPPSGPLPARRPGGGWKKNSWKRHTVFSAQPTPGGWGGYANFFLTHMTKNFTKQSRFKAKIVHVDLLTPSLHQCEDYGPGSTCKAW